MNSSSNAAPGAVLQPLAEVPSGVHYLPATPATVLWGRLPCAVDAPVLTIASGETVTIDTVSHEGILPDQGQDPVAFFGSHGVAAAEVLADAVAIAAQVPRDAQADGPHVVTGPIMVEGAEPGDVLRITVVSLEPRVPYGVVSNRHGRGALPGELPRGGETVSVFVSVGERDGRGVGRMPATDGGEPVVEFPLAPFLGTMGVATDGDERAHSVPPGRHGGNIDINLLVEGTALYLPVQVPGALAYVGDPHFAHRPQGSFSSTGGEFVAQHRCLSPAWSAGLHPRYEAAEFSTAPAHPCHTGSVTGIDSSAARW